jgi:hypothetical protein
MRGLVSTRWGYRSNLAAAMKWRVYVEQMTACASLCVESEEGVPTGEEKM